MAGVVRVLSKLVPWAFEHPFLIRRRWWLTAALAMVALEVLVILFVGGILSFVPLVPLAVVLGGVAGLRKIARRGGKPLVFLCRFDSLTAVAFDASLNHLEALADRLRAHPEFEREIELRLLKASVSERQAQSIARETGAYAVVFGQVRAQVDRARWRGQIVERWPDDDLPRSHVDEYGITLYDKEDIPPALLNLPLDAGHPLSALVEDRFEADHADAIEGTLLVLLGETILSRVDWNTEDASLGIRKEATHVLEKAEAYRAKLSLRGRAHLVMSHEEASWRGQGRRAALDTLDRLEAAANADAGHPDLWDWLSSLAYAAGLFGVALPERRLRYAQKYAELEPEKAEAHYNLALALYNHGKKKAAIAALEKALELNRDDPLLRYHTLSDLGVIAYDQRCYRDAITYLEQALQGPHQLLVHQHLADAYAEAGDYEKAQKHYHLLLRHAPLVFSPALLGYWDAETHLGREAPFRFERVAQLLTGTFYRLPRLNRLIRPLGRVAVKLYLRGYPQSLLAPEYLALLTLAKLDFERAYELYDYAYEVSGMMSAFAGKTLCAAFLGRTEELRHGIAQLDRPRPRANGQARFADDPVPERAERAYAVLNFFKYEPRLFRGNEYAPRVLAMLYDHFSDVLPERPLLLRTLGVKIET